MSPGLVQYFSFLSWSSFQHTSITGTDGWVLHHIVSGAASRFDRRYVAASPQVNSQSFYTVKAGFIFPTIKDTAPTGGYIFGKVRDHIAVFEYYKSDGAYLYAFTSRRRY